MDWLSPDSAPGAPAEAEFGIVLEHGYAHETPDQLGIGAAAVAALARELGRPRETEDHRVVQIQTATAVRLQDTTLALRGDLESVRLAAVALDGLLRDPVALDTTEQPDRRRWAWTGWSSEMRAWFGMGTVAFAAQTDTPWSGPIQELHAFVRALHPGAGRGAVVWVSHPDLEGVAFTDPSAPRRPDLAPLAWRNPSPTASGPGSVTATFVNNLMTARVPDARVSELAVQVMAQTMYRSLVEFGRLAAGLSLTVETVGDDLLVAVGADPSERAFDSDAVRQALLEAMEAGTGVPDQVLAEHIAQAQSGPSLERELRPSLRAINALRRRSRPTTAEIVAALDGLTVADLRASIAGLCAASLLGVAGPDQAPVDRPVFEPPPLIPNGRPSLRRRSVMPLPQRSGLAAQRIRVIGDTLEDRLTPVRRSGRAIGKASSTTLDLANVVIRSDEGTDWTTLVDNEGRRATLTWPAYWRAAPLRERIDAATPPGSRISAPPTPAMIVDLQRRLRLWRIGLVVQAIVFSGFVALFIWAPISGRQTYQQPVVSTVSAGTLVTLANGSSVQLSDDEWQPQTGLPRGNLTARVRYCGGGVTVDRETGDDARNYVTPERFELAGIQPASRVSLRIEPGEVLLRATELQQGQCTDGRIGFEVDSAERPSNALIRYHNGSGDDISWTVS